MTYIQGFQMPDDLFEPAIRALGHVASDAGGDFVRVRDVTVDRFAEYRRIWKSVQTAWNKFEPTIALESLYNSMQYGLRVEDGELIIESPGNRAHWLNTELGYRVNFSAIKDELITMLPKGVTLTVEGSRISFRGIGIAERVLTELGKNSSFFNLTNNTEVGAWEVHTLIGRVLNLSKIWQEGLRAVIKQNREVKPEHMNRHDRAMLAVKKDTGKSLETFISKRRIELRTSEIVINTLPIAEHGTLSSRRWGIEIELAGARGVEAPEYWEKKDDGSLRSAYTTSRPYISPEDCPNGNHEEEIEATLPNGNTTYIDNPEYESPDYCDYCGDSDDEDGSWEDTAEIVSPILRSFHSKGLEQLLKDAYDEPQNYSAGTHVHVEAKDLTPKQLGALVYAYEFIDPLIEASYDREEREYCKRYETSELQELNKRIKNASGDRGYGEGDRLSRGRRYKTVNLQSLDTHGTVEFRAMGAADQSGTINYEFLIRWAHFCREMVNVAKANVPMSVWSAVKTFDDVKRIFALYGKETSELTLAELDFKPEVNYDVIDSHIAYSTSEAGTRELVEV